jgi:site-specific recombinase XerD
LHHLKVEYDSQDTIINLHSSIKRFLEFVNKSSDELTKEDVENYVIHLKESKLSPSSRKQELSRVRKYLREKEIGYTENGQTKSLSMIIKIPKNALSEEKNPFTDEEVEKLFQAITIRFTDPFFVKRTLAIFQLMNEVAIRRKEITLLEWTGDYGIKVSKGQASIYVRRVKRGRPDWYDISHVLYEYILDFLRMRQELHKNDKNPSDVESKRIKGLNPLLFVDKDEEPIKRGRISDDFAECAKIAGIKTGTHYFRHTVLSRATQVTGEPIDLQFLAGDRHAVSVEPYIGLVDRRPRIKNTQRLMREKQERDQEEEI